MLTINIYNECVIKRASRTASFNNKRWFECYFWDDLTVIVRFAFHRHLTKSVNVFHRLKQLLWIAVWHYLGILPRLLWNNGITEAMSWCTYPPALLLIADNWRDAITVRFLPWSDRCLRGFAPGKLALNRNFEPRRGSPVKPQMSVAIELKGVTSHSRILDEGCHKKFHAFPYHHSCYTNVFPTRLSGLHIDTGEADFPYSEPIINNRSL